MTLLGCHSARPAVVRYCWAVLVWSGVAVIASRNPLTILVGDIAGRGGGGLLSGFVFGDACTNCWVWTTGPDEGTDAGGERGGGEGPHGRGTPRRTAAHATTSFASSGTRDRGLWRSG